MVVFTCNHCGESVKKPAVEKHYNTKCRGALKNVSCMDCQRDFRGEEYVAHIKCITEAEKYSGKDYVHKESKNSGAKKQESWMDIIRSILETSEYKLSGQARNVFQRLQSVDNVPRKKAKFQNFVSNCMRISKPIAEEVWNVLEKELEKMNKARQNEAAAAKAAQEAVRNGDVKLKGNQVNGSEEKTPESTQKSSKNMKKSNGVAIQEKGSKRKSHTENGHGESVKKKPKKCEENNDISTAPIESISPADESDSQFKWTAVIEKIVSKEEDGLAIEKLMKKVLKKYVKKLEIENVSDKQQKKLEKKFSKNLKKCSAVNIDGQVVRKP